MPKQPISPLAGEMSGRTEGVLSRGISNFYRLTNAQR
jgi:hypothetical protein